MAIPRACGLASLAALACAGVSPVWAQDRPADWLKRPSMQDLMGVWPASALKNGQGGKAVIGCTVTVQGALRDCRVVSEKPAGQGFGAAALTLSAQLMMRPALKGGAPVEGSIRIPIEWEDLREGSTSQIDGPTMQGGIVSRVVVNLPWSQAPSFEEVRAAFPEKARAAKVSGLTTLDCTLDKTGALGQCRTLQEEPGGYGFGAAARRLSGKFLGPTADSAGASLAGAHVHLPFVFSADAMEGAAPIIGKPQWMALPRQQDLLSVYPKDALKAGVFKGRVVLACGVSGAGALADCQVESEEPAGYGLGQATLGLAATFRLGVWSAEGLPTVGGKVRVPIRFDIKDNRPDPAAAPPKP
jgi:TonB family protein